MNRKGDKVGLGKSLVLENIDEDIFNEAQDEIVRTKSYYLKPTNLEVAIDQMEALGHNFYLYLDEEDDRISLVYKREEGGYGVIQAENKVAK